MPYSIITSSPMAENTISVRYVDKSSVSETTESRVEIEESGPYEEPALHSEHTTALSVERRPSDYEVPSLNAVTPEPLPDGHYDRLEKVKVITLIACICVCVQECMYVHVCMCVCVNS